MEAYPAPGSMQTVYHLATLNSCFLELHSHDPVGLPQIGVLRWAWRHHYIANIAENPSPKPEYAYDLILGGGVGN